MGDDLRNAVGGLMGRARDDLAELVAFKSVADAKQYRDTSRHAVAAKRNFARRRVATNNVYSG